MQHVQTIREACQQMGNLRIALLMSSELNLQNTEKKNAERDP
jgi:hypothetical protein